MIVSNKIMLCLYLKNDFIYPQNTIPMNILLLTIKIYNYQ